ncbi:carbonic anhydrase 1-like isoform X2 [Centruroides sculpturatus]|uniref:carbonic anhydrase 1-like isoform X2 n=1 Tax=Centruroides sculpturatus TaxID=218467 RepID=UPI000C6DCF4B|nr:carbonic anhydrase 1-like isoform X2 [Centruroides sculpturatus]XP_023227247.1 carbonic anhydrase 1-like isoform X2 [Centruroides sculpturatus]
MGTCLAVLQNRNVVQPMITQWGYGVNNGPNHWYKTHPNASGNKQSPVDIVPSLAIPDASLFQNQIRWSYHKKYSKTVVNSGHGWTVEYVSTKNYFEGGPAVNRYILDQIHCHWGKSNERGSEHTINGYQMAAEIHMVHWNSELYKDCRDSACNKQGLLVLASFIKLGQPNVELEKIVKILGNITFKGQRCPLREQVDPAKFIPDNISYWTYEGSLTTPPCHESVTWIVFKNPIEASAEQISKFRSLRCHSETERAPPDSSGGYITLNHRPPQPLFGRLIRHVNYRKSERNAFR